MSFLITKAAELTLQPWQYFLGGLFFGFVMGFYAGYKISQKHIEAYYQKKAIRNKAAQYNPTTGEFEWLSDRHVGR